MEKYDPLRKLDAGIYCVDGEWQKSKFRRRMTVIALSSGDLVLHSPIAMGPADLAELGQLGRVRYIVAPNIFHDSEARFYAERFSESQVFFPEKQLKKTLKTFPHAQATETQWPAQADQELEAIPVRGAWMAETAFIHHASRTLILTDLVFNMGDVFRGVERVLMNWNQVGGPFGFGPSRLCKNFFIRDKKAVGESLQRIFAKDFDRVIMSHGEIIGSGGKSKMIDAFAFLKS